MEFPLYPKDDDEKEFQRKLQSAVRDWSEELPRCRKAALELLNNEYDYWRKQAMTRHEGHRDDHPDENVDAMATMYLNAIRLLKIAANDE